MKRIDTHIKHIIVSVKNPERLLHLVIQSDFFQTGIPTHPMINVCDKITRLQFPHHPRRHRFTFIKTFTQVVIVESLQDLMIGIANDLFIMIHKTLTEACQYGLNRNTSLQIRKNRIQPPGLTSTIRKKEKVVTIRIMASQIFDQKAEIVIKAGLRSDIKFLPRFCRQVQLESIFKKQSSEFLQF